MIRVRAVYIADMPAKKTAAKPAPKPPGRKKTTSVAKRTQNGAGTYGSRSAYTEEKHLAIIEGLLAGNSRSNAFKLTGLHVDSVFEWLRKGRERPEEYPQYVQLLADIEFAEATFESDQVGIVKAAADAGTWQAAAWWLERRKPQEWGRHETVRHDMPAIPAQQVNVLILEDPNAREASRNLLNRLADGRADITVGPGAVRELTQD